MQVNWKRVAWISLLFYLIYSAPTEGDTFRPITIDVYPRIAVTLPSKRVTVRVRWKIERHADNRWQSMSWQSGGLRAGSTGRKMDGENEAVTNQMYVDLWQGQYLFVACVTRVVEGKARNFCADQIVEVK